MGLKNNFAIPMDRVNTIPERGDKNRGPTFRCIPLFCPPLTRYTITIISLDHYNVLPIQTQVEDLRDCETDKGSRETADWEEFARSKRSDPTWSFPDTP